MGISCDDSDRGYEAYSALRKDGKTFDIRLCGANVSHVITADDEDGLIVKFIREKDGRMAGSPGANSANTYRLRGKVEIVVK